MIVSKILWMEAEVLLSCQFSEAQREDLEDIILERSKGKISFNEMIHKMRKRMKAWGALPPKTEPVPEILPPMSEGDRRAAVNESHSRARALSILLAESASQDEDVLKFRDEVLKGKLLKLDDVEGWIEKQGRADRAKGRSTLWLKMVHVPSGHKIRQDQNSYFLDPPLSIKALTPPTVGHIKTLEYLVSGDDWVRKVPMAVGGALERLQALSERLAQDYRWHRAQATLFVLTGTTPLVSDLGVEVQPSRPNGIGTGVSRIVLTVDPMVPPDKVRTHYERIRQKIVGKSQREMRQRQIRLAVFTKLSPEKESWAERMTLWNKIVPDKWRYQSTSNFKRDTEKAVERLLNPFTYDSLIGVVAE